MPAAAGRARSTSCGSSDAGKGMVPAGLMPDDADQPVVLDGDAADATGAGITVEPDGGSTSPTSDPVALFELRGRPDATTTAPAGSPSSAPASPA